MTAVNESPFLSIRHATVRYLDKILFPELTFSMEEGTNWAITGRSGAGKTAFLHTILGKFNVVRGGISYPFFETFLRNNKLPERATVSTGSHFNYRRLIALVSQQPRFLNKRHLSDFYYQQRFNAWDSEDAATVREYLEETFRDVPPEIRSLATRFPMDWVVENLRLGHLLDKTLIKLSNGETRRLLFAQALLTQPLLLLLDNPFTGLDTATRPFFHELLGRIAGRGTRLIIVTAPGEIPPCITHVLELNDGRISATWTRETYLTRISPSNHPGPWEPDTGKLSRVRSAMPPVNAGFRNAVIAEHIHIRYGTTQILDDVSWRVQKGEKWALLGPNGAGKSTLLSLITGDNPQAYANTIYLFDQKRGSGESIWDIKRKIGFLSPEMHQYFMTGSNCLDVVLSGCTDTMQVIPKRITAGDRELALAWMDLLETAGMANRKFKEVSQGSQRLVLLLRALIKNPPLLILDEPCQGLDTEQKAHFKRVIETVFSGDEKTLLYVTHYQEEIPASVDNILHLEQGKVVQDGNSIH